MQLAIRAAVSGLIIATVSLIARSNAPLGGWLAAMPVTSLITTAWLLSEGTEDAKLADFYLAVFFGTIPSALFLLAAAFTIRAGAPTLVGVAAGAVAWLVCTLFARWIGWLTI